MRVKKAVIPAAGLGTRFLPITKAVPKPMLSVVDKPTIQYIVEELESVGIEEILIVISPDCDVIKKHFGSADDLGARLLSDGKNALYETLQKTIKPKIKFVVQTTANGLAGALLCAKDFINEEPFALLLGDELLYADNLEDYCIKNLVDIYENTGKSVIATIEVFGDDVSKYGNIGIESEKDGVIKVSGIIEKPSLTEALSNNAVIGRYVLDGKIISMLEKLKPRNNEIYLTDALESLAKDGKLLAYTYTGERYDVGDKLGYIKANVELALKNKELVEDTKDYIFEVFERLNNN